MGQVDWTLVAMLVITAAAGAWRLVMVALLALWRAAVGATRHESMAAKSRGEGEDESAVTHGQN